MRKCPQGTQGHRVIPSAARVAHFILDACLPLMPLVHCSSLIPRPFYRFIIEPLFLYESTETTRSGLLIDSSTGPREPYTRSFRKTRPRIPAATSGPTGRQWYMAAARGSGYAGRDVSPECDVYHQLKLGTPSSVRLLKLHEQKGGRVVQAELAVFDITDEQCPPFTTVSYTWGVGNSDEHISLNGHEYHVLKSLVPLLHMICANEKNDFDLVGHWFWIDSICINQADISERAAQVKLMTSIYRKAKRTLVWLAEGSEDTSLALDFLLMLREKRHELRQTVNKKRLKRVPSDLRDHPGWASLKRLLLRPWWRRVWTLQEFIIPERLRFYCGSKSISRSEFRQGTAALELCGPLKYMRENVWTTAWNRRRIIDWYQNEHHRDRIPLVSLMATCGDHGASDAHDRVWAVHGLARQEDKDMIGPPTYQDEVHTLYARLVKNFMETFGSLDIICFAQLFTNREDPSWPSWVPDWRVEVSRPSDVPLMVSQSANPALANLRPPKAKPPMVHPRLRNYRSNKKATASFTASGNRAGRVSFCENMKNLSCQGIRIDVIDGLGSSTHHYEIAAVSTSPVNTTKPQEENGETVKKAALFSVARSLVLNRQDKFLETGAPARQYLRELKLLSAACATDSSITRTDNADASDREPSADDSEDGGASITSSPASAPPLTPDSTFNDNVDKKVTATAAAAAAAPPWFAGWWKDNNRPELRIRGYTLEELCQAEEPGYDPDQVIRKTSKSFYARFRGTMKAIPRRLMVTEEGRVGIAPRQAEKGDLVCVLFGCNVPVILRPYPEGEAGGGGGGDASASSFAGKYQFVGECFVDGFMDGEALALGKNVEEFILR